MKRVRSLRLSRETLRRLEGPPLRRAVGGAAAQSNPNSQEGDSCLQSCFFNTCYEGCIWPTQQPIAKIG